MSAPGDRSSPFLGADVTNALREHPVVSFMVLGPVLPLAVFALVEFFHYLGARGFSLLVVDIDIFDENG